MTFSPRSRRWCSPIRALEKGGHGAGTMISGIVYHVFMKHEDFMNLRGCVMRSYGI